MRWLISQLYSYVISHEHSLKVLKFSVLLYFDANMTKYIATKSSNQKVHEKWQLDKNHHCSVNNETKNATYFS